MTTDRRPEDLSLEELQQLLFLMPSMPLVKRTVRPLTEMKSVEGLVSELESIVSSMSWPGKS